MRAQVNLGRMYAKAKGVAPNYGKSCVLVQQGSRIGLCGCPVQPRGVLYVSGIGAPRDYDKARDLFTKAAEQKRQRAISTLV